MKRWILTAAAGLALLVAGAALATDSGDGPLRSGGTVYVRVKNTRIFHKPDASSEPMGPPVQPGTALIWHGKVKGADLPWQQISLHGRRGYVLGSNLSLTKPSDELTVSSASEGNLDADEIASSGDAVKALGPGAKAYGQKLKNETVVPQIETLEKIGVAVGNDPKRLETLQAKNGLNPAGIAPVKKGGAK